MIHQNFSRAASVAFLIIGVIAGIIPALQGTMLFQMQNEGLLSQAELGRVAMAEAIGTLIAVSVANAMLKPERLRLFVVAAALSGAALDLATAKLSGGSILAARFGHGLCAGILLWVWIGFLTRCHNPGRWVAIYVTLQATALLVLSAWFGEVLLPWGGAFAAFAVLATLYGLMVLLAPLVPTAIDRLGHGEGSVMPDLKGLIGLFSVFAQLAAIAALWIYLKPYGKQIGLSDDTNGLAVSIAMGSQIVGGLLVTAMAGRVRAAPLIVLACAGSVASLAALALAREAVPFIAATVAFAFMWMIGPPFHMAYLIDVDPSRRSALHMATAQLLGVAAGPALASLAVEGQNASGAIAVSATLYALGVLAITATGLRKTAALTSSK